MSGIAAAIGAGVAVLGTGFQIGQGIKQRKLAEDARRASAAALAQAKERLDVNRMEGLQVPLEAYGLNTQAILAAQRQALEGMRESGQRAIQGGSQASQEVTQQGLEKQRQKMAKDIYDRDVEIAKAEQVRDRTMGAISLEEAIGFEKQAMDRQLQSIAALSGGVKGVGNVMSAYQKMRPLFNQRQTELDAVSQLQSQGLYGDMNARQARRSGALDEYSQEEISRLAQGLPASVYNFASLGVDPSSYDLNYDFGSGLSQLLPSSTQPFDVKL